MQAGPNAHERSCRGCWRSGQERDRGRRAAADRVQPGDAVIVRPSEAMQWLNAHHVHSPITRHALVVLEIIDAVDLAFDTFVCALLDGEVDTSGYPEYNAIVGGVACALGRGDRRHDRPRRRRLGRQGRPGRHRPDRAARSWRDPDEHPGQPLRDGPDGRSSGRCRPPDAAGSSAPTAASPRRTSGRSTARSAACASCAAEHGRSDRCRSTTTSAAPAATAWRSSTAIHEHGSAATARPAAPRARCGRRSPRRRSTSRAAAGRRRIARATATRVDGRAKAGVDGGHGGDEGLVGGDRRIAAPASADATAGSSGSSRTLGWLGDPAGGVDLG